MVSLWKAISKTKSRYPALENDLEVDVVIVGGGITGITAAKQLIDAGKSVALIEAHELGGVTTSSSTGNLYVPVQPLYQSIENKFDLETAKTVAISRQLAIDYIESTVNEFQIKCHFKKRPWYAYSNNLEDDSLKNELELFKKMDVDVDYTPNLPLKVAFKKAIMMPNQARFNPLQYVVSLAEELHKKGCHLFENTRAIKIDEKSHCTVSTEQATITAKKVIIATHTPIGINLSQFYTAPYRSYVVAVTLKDKNYPEGHFWNMDKASHASLCTHPILKSNPELLMVAGSHHKTGQGLNMENHYKKLSSFLKKQFDVEDIAYQWSAQHFHAADNIPYIGLANASAKHTYMATGYFADGLVYGTLAGIILGDLLGGKENEFFKIYNSNRKDFWKSSPFLLKEGSNVFLQYLKDIPLLTDNHYKDLKNGEGKIVEINRIKYAVSKDNNKLQIVSAVCPHMKGIVAWNNAEHTWDCPLHGSRFTCIGEIIEGPTMCPLHQHDANTLDKGL